MELSFPSNCPHCHIFSGDAYGQLDWKFKGHFDSGLWATSEATQSVRVWKCTECGGLITPDYERTADGNQGGMRGIFQKFVPRPDNAFCRTPGCSAVVTRKIRYCPKHKMASEGG